MRALTEAERLLLEAMIRQAPVCDPDWGLPTEADRARWLTMVDDLSVDKMCDCGTCPTIDLAYKGTVVEAEETDSRTVLEASAPDALMLLFIDDDIPSCLEIAPLDDGPVALPRPEEIFFS